MSDSPDPPRTPAPDADGWLCHRCGLTHDAKWKSCTTGTRACTAPPDHTDWEHCTVHGPPRTPAAPRQQDDPCRFCQSRPPTGCCFAQPPAPQTPMQEQPRAEGPYVTGLPQDQMTALERQLTAQIVLWRQAGEAWAARADELAAQSAVVEAARDVVADIENDGSMRSSTLAKLLAALDALDGSHAAPDEAHSRL